MFDRLETYKLLLCCPLCDDDRAHAPVAISVPVRRGDSRALFALEPGFSPAARGRVVCDACGTVVRRAH